MILVLRGHIRNSFKDDRLYKFIKDLSELYPDLKLYIHTWSVLQSKLSWRTLEENTAAVTETLLLNYFKDLSPRIKKIIIENDQKIQLIGATEGLIRRTKAPLIGWKRYWYGKYQIAKYLKETADPAESVMNTRFDLFHLPYFSHEESVFFSFLQANPHPTKNQFLRNGCFPGMDNFYIGTVDTQFRLAERFHHQLDYIIEFHKNIFIDYQEYYVYYAGV
jgi:hypothetical protein